MNVYCLFLISGKTVKQRNMKKHKIALKTVKKTHTNTKQNTTHPKTVLSDKVGPGHYPLLPQKTLFSFFRFLFGFTVFPEMFRNNSESLTNKTKNVLIDKVGPGYYPLLPQRTIFRFSGSFLALRSFRKCSGTIPKA